MNKEIAEAGEPAPDFELESDGGGRVSLADFEGKWLIVYFYPKDNTPGCTREAQAFTASGPRLAKLGAAVLGISKDSVKSHCGFRDKIGIRFPLLSDPDLAAHKAYGAWGMKTMYGKKVEGTIRSTFLVAPDGTIARAWRSVKVDGHADAVEEALREAQGGGPSKTPAKAKKAPAKAEKARS
jgi:peroxiredoxin Q/BCP